jgi:hypothetical protein
MQRVTRSLAAILFLVPAPATVILAQSGPAALTITIDGGATKVFSAAELLGMPQTEVVTTGRDSTRIVFRGPTLRSLMAAAGAPAGHELRGPNMLLAVLAEASDGYKAAYMLAELDEQFGARVGILAVTQDGKPIPAAEGPYRVVMAGEAHRARWIRQVIKLRLLKVGG